MAKKSAGKAAGVNKTKAIRDALASNPDALPNQIAAELSAQGIEVSANYVSNVKSTSKSASKPKGRGKKKGSRAGGASKSQAIKDALAKDPSASPKMLAEQLVAQGVDVTPAYVSTIKTGLKSQGEAPRPAASPAPRPAARASLGNGNFVASELFDAKRLVDQVGGIDKAQKLLEVLKKLQ